MTPDEVLHRSAEIAAEEKARRMPDFLRRVFAVLIGGVGGELGFVVFVIVVAEMIGDHPADLTAALASALKLGPALGFLPGVLAGLVYTRISRGRHKAYLSFLFGAAAGLLGVFPIAAIVFVILSLF